MQHRIWAKHLNSLCRRTLEGHQLWAQEDKQVTSQSLRMCVSSCRFIPRHRACWGTRSYHFKFQSNSHSVAVPGCDNAQTHICCSVFVSALQCPHCLTNHFPGSESYHFKTPTFVQYKLNAQEMCGISGWICMLLCQNLSELFWAKYPRTDCRSVDSWKLVESQK